jgi:hypothetical protein
MSSPSIKTTCCALQRWYAPITPYASNLLTRLKLFSVIQFGLVWTGVAHGNGKFIDLVSPQHLVQVQKVCNSN